MSPRFSSLKSIAWPPNCRRTVRSHILSERPPRILLATLIWRFRFIAPPWPQASAACAVAEPLFKAAELLAAEFGAASDELDGAVLAFLALALADLGREREALSHSLTALSRCLPRYNRSLARYAAELMVSQGSELPNNAP
jgi:hypothetical protein